jgi:hypothetical protein
VRGPLPTGSQGNDTLVRDATRPSPPFWLVCGLRASDVSVIGLLAGTLLVGARGFEPLTSSASRKRSPPELSARADIVSGLEAGTGIEPVCEALQASA